MAPEDLADEAASGLLHHLGALTRRVRQRPSDGDLSPAEAVVLGRLVEGPSLTVADLARAERVRPQSMGETVGALEARGLVKRHRDRRDGRRVLLGVTAAGRERSGRRRTTREAEVAAALLAGFTEAELRQLAACAPLLGRLAEGLTRPD